MKKLFPIYDATPYLNKPMMMTQRMKPIRILYESAFWLNSESKENFPSQARIDAAINNLISTSYKGLVIFDIEYYSWNFYVDPQKIDWLLQIMAMFRQADPTWTLGHYAIAPKRNHTSALLPTTSAEYKAWQAENDKVIQIASASDVLCPSIYTVVQDQVRWESWVVQNILEAQRYWPQKPVIPFIWPQYHNTLPGYGLKYIDDQFWMHQLMTCWRMCDGVIIWKNWTNPLETFSWQMPWAIPTETFIEKYVL